ncbi:MAG: alpha/beta fold hydrolase [Eggerthellaceae bacterium]|nr:alpha/beta fold hydrolase [Eggerthellaceae bacterium]
MGAIVLAALVVVEAAVLIASIKMRSSKRDWIRTRTIASVCEAVVLALLMALPISNISFDFRWEVLLVVLAVRAAIALIVFLTRSKKANTDTPYRIPRIVFNVLGSIVVIAIAVVPALVFPPYNGLPTTGNYDVSQAHAIMIDESRTDSFEQDGSYCEIPVWFYYPDNPDESAGQFPLVVFSHGAFGYHESNFSLYAELASNGYVVAALDYPHHSFFTTNTQGETIIVDRDFITQATAVQGGELSEDESYPLTRAWMQLRMDDLSFALETIEAAVKGGLADDSAWFFDSDEQKELVQQALRMTGVDKVGLVGHSMGGATSVGQGRIRDEIEAVVDLDGTMFTEYEYNGDGTYAYIEDPYPVPLLSVDSEQHYQSGLETSDQGQKYVNTYVLDNAKTSAHTYFKGSGHMNFTDLPLFSPMLASMLGTGDIDAQACIEQTNALVLAWLDEHLKGQGHASIEGSY